MVTADAYFGVGGPKVIPDDLESVTGHTHRNVSFSSQNSSCRSRRSNIVNQRNQPRETQDTLGSRSLEAIEHHNDTNDDSEDRTEADIVFCNSPSPSSSNICMPVDAINHIEEDPDNNKSESLREYRGLGTSQEDSSAEFQASSPGSVHVSFGGNADIRATGGQILKQNSSSTARTSDTSSEVSSSTRTTSNVKRATNLRMRNLHDGFGTERCLQASSSRRISPLSLANADFLRMPGRSIYAQPSGQSLIGYDDSELDGIQEEDDDDTDLPLIPLFVYLLAFLALLIVPCYVLPAMLLDDVQVLTNPLTHDIQFELYVVGTSALPIGMFLLFAAVNLGRGSTTGQVPPSAPTSKKTKQCLRSFCTAFRECLRSLQTPILLFVAVANYHFREMCVKVVQEQFQTSTANLLYRVQAITLYVVLHSFLEDIKLLASKYADRLDRCALESRKSQKWISIMKNFSRFKDFEVDKSYVIPGGSRSPSRVLAEIVTVYCGIGKAFGLILLVLYLVGVDIATTLVVLGLTVAFGTVVQALHVNEALQNVLPLAMSNAFHVGEIISVSRTGGKPGDLPAESLSGFVEGVTWGHIIIRDFRKKQVFIPHRGLHGMQISNWARRPAKLCRFVIPVEPAFSRGAEPLARLAKFGRQWIKDHPEIDHTGYTKCALRYREHIGMALEVIFYPNPGSKSAILKAEFIVMIVEAARRLNICITKAEVRSSKGWEDINEENEGMEQNLDDIDTVLEDLRPSPSFTMRSGHEPKVKKL